MKANLFIKALFTFMLSFNVLQLPGLLAETNVDDCSNSSLRAFFPEKYLHNTLKKFDVPQDKWAPLTEALSNKEKEIIPQIEAKAQKMNPNPLKDREHQKVAVKLFKETIFEIAKGPFNANGIQDEKQIQAMLDDIQSQKTKQFQECIKMHKLPLMPEKEMAPK